MRLTATNLINTTMIIIVKKYSNSQRFFPHYSNSFGKFVHTKADYLKEMKERKLEPYNPNQKGRVVPDPKISKEGKEVIKSIYDQTDRKGNFNPSGRLKEKLIKSGVMKKRSDIDKIEKKYRAILKDGKDGFTK